MRIDKFLKNARIIKRRTVAKEACEAGRISLNGRPAKAGSEVEVGDEISIEFGSKVLKCRVMNLIESPKKQDAASMYEEI